MEKFCYCHSQLPYSSCCQALHSSSRYAKNALELMKSRYSAYCLGLTEYIIMTTDPQGPIYQHNLQQWRKELQDFCQQTNLINLTIKDYQIQDPFKQSVSFEVRVRESIFSLRKERTAITKGFFEKSLFFKKNGLWLYHSALEHHKILS